jgi:hypothetical protein
LQTAARGSGFRSDDLRTRQAHWSGHHSTQSSHRQGEASATPTSFNAFARVLALPASDGASEIPMPRSRGPAEARDSTGSNGCFPGLPLAPVDALPPL